MADTAVRPPTDLATPEQAPKPGPADEGADTESAARTDPEEWFAGFRDIRLPAEVTLGTGTLTIRQCLGLRRNSVVHLLQSAGDDLDLLVRGVPVAKAEVVIMDDSTAVRLTEILPRGTEPRS